MKKQDNLGQSTRSIPFWFCAVLIAILIPVQLGRKLNRPFYGLHSWAEASGSWAARSHVKYGLSYTKGVSTWAVGDPPAANPRRYFDHPQLGVLSKAAVLAVFGVNEVTSRITGVFLAVICLLMLLKILRQFLDEPTALLAGVLYSIFPLTAYFGTGGWPTIFGFAAIWCYLVLIREVFDGPAPSTFHKIGLAASLFLSLQFSWGGFFFAFAIGLHYVIRCLLQKRWPNWPLLAILTIAPLSSLALNFAVMAIGYGGFSQILELFKWRAGKGEMQYMASFDWNLWFKTFWSHAVDNFTLPILIAAILYLTVGQLFVWMETKPDVGAKHRPRQFPLPLFLLFIITPVTQLFLLRGALWKHQAWEMPFGPVIAIAAALGVMLLIDLLKKVHRNVAVTAGVLVMTIFIAFCMKGTNYYYAVRWQPKEKIELFKKLNQLIPPDKALLSFEPFIVDQHESKGAFYRPEVAWYLDRDITQAKTFEDVQKYAATGRYPCYLVPLGANPDISKLVAELRKHYKTIILPGHIIDIIPPVEGTRTKDGKFITAGMYPYIIFDLTTPR